MLSATITAASVRIWLRGSQLRYHRQLTAGGCHDAVVRSPPDRGLGGQTNMCPCSKDHQRQPPFQTLLSHSLIHRQQ